MSTLGGQQFLYPAKPFNEINVSGIAPNAAVGALAETRQGELNRNAQASMQTQELQSRENIAAQDRASQEGIAAQQLAQGQESLDLQAQQQKWQQDQIDLERSKAERLKSAKAQAARLVAERLAAKRSGDLETADVLDQEYETITNEVGLLQSQLDVSGQLIAIFNETMSPGMVRQALETLYQDKMGADANNRMALIAGLSRGIMMAMTEVGGSEKPLETIDADQPGFFGKIGQKLVDFSGKAPPLGSLGEPEMTTDPKMKALGGTTFDLEAAGISAPAVFAKRMAEAVSFSQEVDGGAGDTPRLQQLFESVIRASTNPEGSDDSQYMQTIKDAVQALTAPTPDGKMGPWDRSELDLLVRSLSVYATGGAQALQSALVGEDLQAVAAEIASTEQKLLPEGMGKYGQPLVDFQQNMGNAWGVYAQAMGGEVNHNTFDFSVAEGRRRIGTALLKIMDDPTITPDQYVSAFENLPQDIAEDLARELVLRSDLFVSRLQQYPELVRRLEGPLTGALRDQGLGALQDNLTGLGPTISKEVQGKQSKASTIEREATRMGARGADRSSQAPLYSEIIAQMLEEGESPDAIQSFLSNLQ